MSESIHGLLDTLLDAGFTVQELDNIASDLAFGIIAIAEGFQSKPIRLGVDWTPEKRAAWAVVMPQLLAQIKPAD